MELHQQVLSYTPARDAARYRRVCKSTNQLVRDSERFLLRTYAGGALSRLKEAVDEFNDLETPHDTDSLVEALHVWTKRRGQFPDSRNLFSSFGSILKLMAHFFLKKDHDDQMVDRVGIALDWALIAKKYVVILTKPQTELSMERHYLDIAKQGLLSDNEIDKLFRYAQGSQNQRANHRLSGQLWPEQKLEYMTFPIVRGDSIPYSNNPQHTPREFGHLATPMTLLMKDL